jgi:biopolymer transport protein ExbD
MDVIFILLIFFMMNDQIIQEQGLQLQLPEAKQSKPILEEHLSIEINALNQLVFNENFISLPELKAKLKDEKRSTKVLIRGDRDASYGKALKVFDLLRGLGFQQVTLGTLPPRL